MGRPKGSKNKKKLIIADSALGDLIAQRTEEKAALEAELAEIKSEMQELATRGRAIKANIKKLDKELAGLKERKEAADAATEAAAAREAIQRKVAELMAEGKRLEEIMEMLS